MMPKYVLEAQHSGKSDCQVGQEFLACGVSAHRDLTKFLF